jgi:hypothetical protein
MRFIARKNNLQFAKLFSGRKVVSCRFWNPYSSHHISNPCISFLRAAESVNASAKPTIRLSPESRTVLKRPDAISTLPLGIIRSFLTYDQALSQEEIDSLPYVLGSSSAAKSATESDVIYVKGQLEQGASYALYRQGRPYIDSETGETLGYETRLVATVRAFRAGQDATEDNAIVPASLQVLNIQREIRQGDKVIPAYDTEALPAHFLMSKPQHDIEGTIRAADSE